MKRLKIMTIVILVVISIVGCENSTSKKAIEQGKLLMASKEYDKALASFKLAIDEGSKDEYVATVCSIIEIYNKANNKFEEGNVQEAKVIIDGINKEYVEYSIKDDVDYLKGRIDEKVKIQDEINNNIEKLKDLVMNKSYNDAKILIEELNQNELTEKNKEELKQINNNIDSELAKIEADKKAKEQEQVKKDYFESENDSNSNITQKYICENCDKISEEHNFIAGMTACNTCFNILYEEIMNFE